MKDKNIIQIFDTTLRDGEQSPGASLNTDEKMQVARQLAKLKVDIIEAGFPIASPGDFEAVRMIATEIEGPIIAGLARAKKVDIDRAWEAVKVSAKPRIHTFIATSPIHMERKLKMKPEEVLKSAVEAVQLAKSYTEDVEFSPEDAGRTEHQFLFEVVEAVIEAGATVVNIPDTVGYQTPLEFGKLIADIKEKVPNIDKAIISVHCHNDLGLAVANSLAAVANGAGQIECTINGLGERAGNAALEEVVMALKTREDFFDKKTNIDTKEIYRASRLVSNLTGIVVQPNKAVVGSNAFAHEAGIHQHGVLSDKRTYEIMDVEAVGVGESKLVLGKHSGRHAFAARLEEMGYSLDAEKLNRAFEHFKVLADKKKEIFDRDLEVLLEDEIFTIPETYTLEYIHVSSGTTLVPMATVKLKKGEEILQDASNGDGPVDAAYRAIDRITGIPTTLIEYSIQAITRGKDAQGEVVVKIRDNGNTFTGKGVSTDIIEASAKGYVNAINKMLHRRSKS